jgi:CBS domain-containing protein
MQTTVRDILRHKGGNVISVRAEQSILELVQILTERNIGAVLVMDEAKLVGVVSERDVARSIHLFRSSDGEMTVGEIMARDVISVGPESTVAECMTLVTNNRVRHLPVMEAGHVIGVVSIGDLVNSTITEKQFVIEQLEGYITGRI